MKKNKSIHVLGANISIIAQNNIDFISLTDMTSSLKEGSGLIGKWITNKNTLEYLGIWEKINNPIFNYTEFGVIEQELPQTERLIALNKMAISQMKSLLNSSTIKKINELTASS